jgi:hypothetical protein
MSRRLAVIIVLVLGLTSGAATAVHAQETVAAPLDLTPAAAAFNRTSPLVSAEQIQRALPPPPSFRRTGPSALMTSLYASTAVMQALDVHSTLTAFGAGAVEANPLMEGVTRNRAAFMAVKVGVAASTILAARQLSKRNKVAAVVTLVAINSAYAMVVQHNYKVARSLR